MLRAVFVSMVWLFAAGSASADIAPAAARACGVSDAVIAASDAARPVLAAFDHDAAFADRGSGWIRIIEFADFSCPSCRALHPQWVAFAKANPDVRISVVEYPIYGRTIVSQVTGNKTLDASRIAIAAGAQGRQLAFHDALMSIPGRVDDRAIAMAAKRAGLDFISAQRLAQSLAIKARADANLRLATRLGFTGTPHVVVDGILLSREPGWNLGQVECLVRASRAAPR